jgi:hypothetical protein
VVCGKLGQPACQNNVACTAPFTFDNNGVCVACGGPGQRCCDGAGGRYCGAGASCGQNQQCEPCGAATQLCCMGRFCDLGTACNQGSGRCN